MPIRPSCLALVAALLMTGCPGSIDDPARFRNAGSTCPDDFDVEQDLFRATCARLGCHTGGPALAAAGLDLGTPGVGPRLLAHRSAECGGRLLVDPHDLASSYLLEKVDRDEPECGDRMPDGMAPLNATERACLGAYLEALAATVPDGAVPPPLVDAGAPPEGDAGEPSPVTIEAESMTLSGYEVDSANAGLIRIPEGQASGTARAAFQGARSTYHVTIHARAEIDGQPTLILRIAEAQVAEETYPLATTDLEPATFGPYDVELAPGDEIVLEGRAADGAWARVDRLEVVP